MLGGIDNDIDHSSYEILESGPCVDYLKMPKDASSKLDDLGGTICFSADQLTKDKATAAELITLAIHEHAHHFGDKDFDGKAYPLYDAVYPIVSLEKASPVENSSPLPRARNNFRGLASLTI